eukprot:Gregarina_sp_Poly_1__243@NODE_1057_length_5213_cov_40_228333_g735_i0_p5_GENE_NODE_1057_length_5213_cov_40_228333_g735_i0NODE_1057_length_5213_cov_40_228333_g735_i0_p5_ORF_typecomplete_len126_score13_48_NODE_1057_length_5213_cov_40_228333_g735_i044594836
MFDTAARIIHRIQHDSPEEIGDCPLQFDGFIQYPKLTTEEECKNHPDPIVESESHLDSSVEGESRDSTVKCDIGSDSIANLEKFLTARSSLRPFEKLAKGRLIVKIIESITECSSWGWPNGEGAT